MMSVDQPYGSRDRSLDVRYRRTVRRRWKTGIGVGIGFGTALLGLMAYSPAAAAETDSIRGSVEFLIVATFVACVLWPGIGLDARVGGQRLFARVVQPRRVAVARLSWLLRAVVWGPSGSVWAWTRALCAAAALTVLLHTVVDPAVGAVVAEPLTIEQAARYADRATWILDSGWPAHVPGLTILSAAAAEEILFRAPLLLLAANMARRSRLTYTRRTRFLHMAVLVVGVAISTALFGLHHADYSTSNVVTAAVNGFFWALLALWTKSLLPSIASHTTVNLLALY